MKKALLVGFVYPKRNLKFMSKLPFLTPKKLLRILQKGGFEIDHTTGSHYILYNQ